MLDQPQNIGVDGLNQRLKPPGEPEINYDCTSSESDHVPRMLASSTASFSETENFAVGSPQHVTEAHVARQDSEVISSATTIFGLATLYSVQATSTSFTLFTTSIISSPNSLSSSAHSTSQLSLSDSYGPSASPSSCDECSPAFGATTTSLQLVLPTVSSSSGVLVSTPFAQPTAISDTSPNSPNVAATAGGATGAVALLALLVFIVTRYRRKKKLLVTPFNLPPTAETVHLDSEPCVNSGNVLPPMSIGPSFVRHPDACFVELSMDRCPSFATDPVYSHLPPNDDDASASTIARHRRTNELEKLYPSRALPSYHRCHCSVANRIGQAVMEDCSRTTSETLPAYRSAKSLKNGEADRDDH
ncbi:hypothetical protein DEU56DRAFT_979574 [Suillus clintonianus]|uniref:uncharacterized protein n=1 Tax=Suillus clintonianus TaxID=1904413 RepID=UPI001B86E1D2|nr:uncharacterized protein DEU56DRAFT_979574 [Suillus clintonianus]KAG2142391.1 hypothetical protein DEU56DRAFT_979574 [Suillus clintonianus]